MKDAENEEKTEIIGWAIGHAVYNYIFRSVIKCFERGKKMVVFEPVLPVLVLALLIILFAYIFSVTSLKLMFHLFCRQFV